MSDTIIDMPYVKIDVLSPDQLENGDIIKYDGEYLTVKSVDYVDGGYSVFAEDDFGEEFDIFVKDNSTVDWYIYEY